MQKVSYYSRGTAEEAFDTVMTINKTHYLERIKPAVDT